jgi:hypothetical protein
MVLLGDGSLGRDNKDWLAQFLNPCQRGDGSAKGSRWHAPHRWFPGGVVQQNCIAVEAH